jgi:hypothetical protein
VKGCPDPATKGGEAFADDGAGGAVDRSTGDQCERGHNREGGMPTGDRAVALGGWMPAAARREEGTLTGGEAWPR